MKGGGRVMDFEQLYNTYFKDVYLYIRKLSGNQYIAEEVTSETFFKAIGSIENFRKDCDFYVWLCQIAKNTYYSSLKKQKRISHIEDFELENMVDPHSCIDDKIIIQEQTIKIQKLLHAIPEPYKEVFMWRVFADLSFKQIGQIFNKSDNWACVTYHRARTMLKNRLEDSYYEK